MYAYAMLHGLTINNLINKKSCAIAKMTTRCTL